MNIFEAHLLATPIGGLVGGLLATRESPLFVEIACCAIGAAFGYVLVRGFENTSKWFERRAKRTRFHGRGTGVSSWVAGLSLLMMIGLPYGAGFVTYQVFRFGVHHLGIV